MKRYVLNNGHVQCLYVYIYNHLTAFLSSLHRLTVIFNQSAVSAKPILYYICTYNSAYWMPISLFSPAAMHGMRQHLLVDNLIPTVYVHTYYTTISINLYQLANKRQSISDKIMHTKL